MGSYTNGGCVMTDLVKVNNSELAAQMEDIKSKMGDVIAAAISPNTRRA